MTGLRLSFKSITTLLIFFIIIGGCNNGGSGSSDQRLELPEPAIIERLHFQKWNIDTFVVWNRFSIDSFTLFGNVATTEDEPGTEYLVFKDSLKNIVRIEEYPFSQSGDWAMTIIHYFDKKEKTFAIERRTGSTRSACGNETTYEVKTSFYDQQFRLIYKEQKLSDGQTGKPIADSCSYSFPEEGYIISPSSADYLEKAGLNKSQPRR